MASVRDLPPRLLGGRRGRARDVVAYIDLAPLKVEHDRWAKYVSRLTGEERQVLAGEFAADSFSRPREKHLPRPRLPVNQWIPVVHNLHVKLELHVMADHWVYKVTNRLDDRSGTSTPMKSFRGSPLAEAGTLYPLDGSMLEPEPSKLPAGQVKNLPRSVAARARYAELHGEDVQRRRRRSLIEDLRSADLSVEQLEQLRAAFEEIRSQRQAAA